VTLRIDKGDPAPWVEAGPNPGGQFFTVHCKRCGGTVAIYTVTLRREPGLLAENVALHNACVPRLGALDPWEPGTP
jgi:hypothetical protein